MELVCIYRGGKKFLTPGKSYKTTMKGFNQYIIVDDSGYQKTYPKSLFAEEGKYRLISLELLINGFENYE